MVRLRVLVVAAVLPFLGHMWHLRTSTLTTLALLPVFVSPVTSPPEEMRAILVLECVLWLLRGCVCEVSS